VLFLGLVFSAALPPKNFSVDALEQRCSVLASSSLLISLVFEIVPGNCSRVYTSPSQRHNAVCEYANAIA